MSAPQNSRRQFIKTSLMAALAAIPVLNTRHDAFAAKKKVEGKDAPLPPGMTEVSPSDPVAAAIGYKPNVKDIDFAKYPQRKKPEAKDQFCKNCALYTTVNNSWGNCRLLTSGLVNAHGWCGSYSKKA